MSVSQKKRLELNEGAEELYDNDRKDFVDASVLIPKLLLPTPNPGTQQDFGQDILLVSAVSE